MRKQKRGIGMILTAIVLCVVLGVNVHGASIEDVQREVNYLEFQRQNTQEGRDALDAELNEVIGQMVETNQLLMDKSEKIVETEFELMNALVEENNQYQSMLRRIQFMYENGGLQILELLLSSESIGDFINKAEYIDKITSADRELLVEFQETIELVVEKEAVLREEEEVLVELQSELIEQQEHVEELLEAADLELDDLHARIGENAILLEELILQAELERIRQQEAEEAQRRAEEEAEAARLAQEEADRLAEEEALAAEEADVPSEEVEVPVDEENNDSDSGNENDSSNNNENDNQAAEESEAPPPPPPDGGGGQFFHPLPNGRLTSPFGWRAFDNRHHNGADFAAPEGTPIFAAEAGTVVISGFSHSAGNWVVINHGGGLVTMYMHNSVNQVSVGQQVSRGQQIALVGNTGRSFGAHLHFQVEVNGVPQNPLNFL